MRNRIAALPRPLLPLALIVAALPLLVPLEGHAQFGGQQFRTAPKLTQRDLAMIRKLVREDLPGKPNGTTLSWNNPDSSNSGTVTLLATFRSQGRHCLRVRYFIKPGPNQPSGVRSNTYVLNNCRLADGSWKLDSQAKPDHP
jgi:surface antigen